MIMLKRAYEPASKEDGYRILIDRLWPRGIKKSDLPLNEWAKDLAPSNELRKIFGHNPDKWNEFRARYQWELHAKELKERIHALARRAYETTLTLIYSARDEKHNNAVVLKEVLERVLKNSAFQERDFRKSA